jgi:hypothetical protein
MNTPPPLPKQFLIDYTCSSLFKLTRDHLVIFIVAFSDQSLDAHIVPSQFMARPTGDILENFSSLAQFMQAWDDVDEREINGR